MRSTLIGLFLFLLVAEHRTVWAQEPPQQVRPKIMPPVPKFAPSLPATVQQNEKDQPFCAPFSPPVSYDWSDFIYRSEQEKEFWEMLPDWSSVKEIASKPRDKNGEELPNDTVPGYTGYAKWKDHSHRMILRLENGWVNKEMTWYRSGAKTSQISYLGGKKNGPALTWHQYRFPIPKPRRPSIPGRPQSKPTPTKQASGWMDQNKAAEGNYKDDKKQGLWNFYDYEGNKSQVHTYKDGIKEGPFVQWRKNGQKKEEGNHKKGKKHGLWTSWYENGLKMSEVNFKNGEHDGPSTEWYENGQMMMEGTYQDKALKAKAFYNPEGGKFGNEIQASSTMRDWTDMAIDISSRWDANGSAIKNSEAKGFDGYAYNDFYYEDYDWGKEVEFAVYEVRNGWIVKILESWDYWEESSYRNGSLDGPYKNWYWSGAKAEEGSYENDLLKTASAWKPNGERCPATRVTAGSGKLVKYDQQGNKTELLTYAGGKKEGPFVQWRANGQKKKEGSYGNEKLHGIEIHYYQDGNKSHSYTYKEGKKEGVFISWYKNGQKQEEVTHAESLMRDENSVPKISSPLKIPRPSIPLRSGARHSSLASRLGPFRSWYENGQKKQEGNYENGQRHGLWTDWYENGILRTEGTYKRGNRDGTFSSWHSNGQKKEEGNYVDGKLHEPWIHYDQDGNKSHSYTYKEGKKEGLFISWHENGQKHKEITYSESLAGIKASPRRIPSTRTRNSSSAARFGPFRSWYENGLLKTEGAYKRGKLDGTFSSWHENGQKKEGGLYKDGKREDVHFIYHENGNKSHSYTYKEGKKEGPFVQWYKNGQKDEEGNYKDGKRNGLWTFWYEDGNKRQERNYKDGKLISAVVWKPNGERCPETKIDQNGDGIIVSYDENGNKKMETPFSKGRFRFVLPKKPVPRKQMPPVPKFRPPTIQNLSPLPNVSTPPKKVVRIPKPVAPKSEPIRAPDPIPHSNEIDLRNLPPPPPSPNLLPPSAPTPDTKPTREKN